MHTWRMSTKYGYRLYYPSVIDCTVPEKSCLFGFENDICCMPFGNLRPKVMDRLHQLHHRETLILDY